MSLNVLLWNIFIRDLCKWCITVFTACLCRHTHARTRTHTRTHTHTAVMRRSALSLNAVTRCSHVSERHRGSVCVEPLLKACLRFLFSYWLLRKSQIDWQLPGPITERDAVVLGVATRASFFLTFPSISVDRHYHLLFNRDNMATAASRYYSEDGRATKRQKTDGMATVSRACEGCPELGLTDITNRASVCAVRFGSLRCSVGKVTTRRSSFICRRVEQDFTGFVRLNRVDYTCLRTRTHTDTQSRPVPVR